MPERIPPGQFVTAKFPVLQHGEIPQISKEAWSLTTSGFVEKPIKLDWKAFLALPQAVVQADMHCVTKWSRLDNKWEGVLFKTICELTKPLPNARHALLHSYDGYSTNVSLEALADEDVILAYKHDGQPLTPEHGSPVRLVVPKRYGWKSAKWLKEIEFISEDKRGFWEERGYHNNGDPWKNERFRWQEECADESGTE